MEKLVERPDDPRAGGPVLRLPFLAGREELLAELDGRLAGDDGSEPRVAALTRLGGAGKTSVAVEYARQHWVRWGGVAAPGWECHGAGGRVHRAGGPARHRRGGGRRGPGSGGALGPGCPPGVSGC